MTDYTELKLKAEHAVGFTDMSLAPDMVLALIVENERLTAQVSTLQTDANSWQSGYDEGRRMGTKTALAERDQLKAENELMRHRLGACAEELRKASDWICKEVEVPTKSATHWAVRLKANADQIDAALSKGEQP